MPTKLEKVLEKEGYDPKSKNYIGIDYGRGTANRDLEKGIHYGVINQHEVLQVWADSSEPAYLYCCPKCGHELKKGYEAKRCPKCFTKINADEDFQDLDPYCYFVKDGRYEAACNEDGDIFVTKSPYYTRCNFCSPCAPGAGYLLSPNKKGVKAYCFSHDWFEGGKAPYPVYRVDNNMEVLPEKFQI